jgi:hypothetical protein
MHAAIAAAQAPTVDTGYIFAQCTLLAGRHIVANMACSSTAGADSPLNLSMKGSASACMPTLLSSVTASTYRSCRQAGSSSSSSRSSRAVVTKHLLAYRNYRDQACLHSCPGQSWSNLVHYLHAFRVCVTLEPTCSLVKTWSNVAKYVRTPGMFLPVHPALAVLAAHTSQPELSWCLPCGHSRRLHQQRGAAAHARFAGKTARKAVKLYRRKV